MLGGGPVELHLREVGYRGAMAMACFAMLKEADQSRNTPPVLLAKAFTSGS